MSLTQVRLKRQRRKKSLETDDSRPGFFFRIWPFLTFCLFALAFFLIYVGGLNGLAVGNQGYIKSRSNENFFNLDALCRLAFAFLSYRLSDTCRYKTISRTKKIYNNQPDHARRCNSALVFIRAPISLF